ncbi:MAG: SpoIID/LytB domain-containing protein [Thermoleophilia bacterium]|nr:SpoIID/LytB domain-containing protein [Thermoleophilia bacterium]
MRLSRNQILAALTTTLLAAVVLLVPASRADATWTVKGGGFGHGVGMSAYGAYGMAKAGFSHKRILRHYYSGTRIHEVRKAHDVKVLLNVDGGNAYFSGAGRACGVKLNGKRTYGAKLKGSKIMLIRRSGKKLANCKRKLRTETDGKVIFKGIGRYRGGVVVVPSGSGGLNVVNRVGINAYVKGVIPNESIPSWPMKALRTQAVASRTFALSGGVDGRGYDLYNDTRSQVYGDIGTEYGRTNRAASQTSNQIVSYKGEPALTVFSASSGGHTENAENVFFGGSVPYLKGVKDPYDSVSPYYRWTVNFSNADMNARLGGYVSGRLKKIKITRYGVSKRVIWARLYGTAGQSKIRGDSFQYALGLMDRLVFSIKRGSRTLDKTTASQPAEMLPPGAGSGTVAPMGTSSLSHP